MRLDLMASNLIRLEHKTINEKIVSGPDYWQANIGVQHKTRLHNSCACSIVASNS